MAEEQGPLAVDVQQQFRTLDPATRELFYGSGIPGTDSYNPGFLGPAFDASNKTFFDEQGNPLISPEMVAGLSPDQQRAIQLSRDATGIQTPFIEEAGQSYQSGLQDLFRGTDTARGLGREALGNVAGGVGQERSFTRRLDSHPANQPDDLAMSPLPVRERARVWMRTVGTTAVRDSFGSSRPTL